MRAQRTVELGDVAGLLLVPVLLGAVSAASLVVAAVASCPRPATAAPLDPPSVMIAEQSARASGKLMRVDAAYGSFIVELAVETDSAARIIRTFVMGHDLPVERQGHMLLPSELPVGNFVTVDYITRDGAYHARAVTVPDVPSRV